MKELTSGPQKRALVHLPEVVFCVFMLNCLRSAVFIWRPLAGREGRTVIFADVDQALTGLEASQRLAAAEGGQGPTQAHHGGGVVLFCKGATHMRREGQLNCFV